MKIPGTFVPRGKFLLKRTKHPIHTPHKNCRKNGLHSDPAAHSNIHCCPEQQ
jgi:hypothetical protein